MNKDQKRDQDRDTRVANTLMINDIKDAQQKVTVDNPANLKYEKLMKFSDGDFPDYFKEIFQNFGFNNTTPIQQHCIPVAMEYNDVIGIA